MTTFHASPAQYMPALVMGTFVMGAFFFAAIFSGDLGKAVTALIPAAILAGMYWWVWRQTRHPTLQVDQSRLRFRGTLGRDYDIPDIAQYTLVVSTDWVGLRRKGQQDIMIDQNRFTRRTWNELVACLKGLPFEKVI